MQKNRKRKHPLDDEHSENDNDHDSHVIDSKNDDDDGETLSDDVCVTIHFMTKQPLSKSEKRPRMYVPIRLSGHEIKGSKYLKTAVCSQLLSKRKHCEPEEENSALWIETTILDIKSLRIACYALLFDTRSHSRPYSIVQLANQLDHCDLYSMVKIHISNLFDRFSLSADATHQSEILQLIMDQGLARHFNFNTDDIITGFINETCQKRWIHKSATALRSVAFSPIPFTGNMQIASERALAIFASKYALHDFDFSQIFVGVPLLPNESQQIDKLLTPWWNPPDSMEWYIHDIAATRILQLSMHPEKATESNIFGHKDIDIMVVYDPASTAKEPGVAAETVPGHPIEILEADPPASLDEEKVKKSAPVLEKKTETWSFTGTVDLVLKTLRRHGPYYATFRDEVLHIIFQADRKQLTISFVTDAKKRALNYDMSIYRCLISKTHKYVTPACMGSLLTNHTVSDTFLQPEALWLRTDSYDFHQVGYFARRVLRTLDMGVDVTVRYFAAGQSFNQSFKMIERKLSSKVMKQTMPDYIQKADTEMKNVITNDAELSSAISLSSSESAWGLKKVIAKYYTVDFENVFCSTMDNDNDYAQYILDNSDTPVALYRHNLGMMIDNRDIVFSLIVMVYGNLWEHVGCELANDLCESRPSVPNLLFPSK